MRSLLLVVTCTCFPSVIAGPRRLQVWEDDPWVAVGGDDWTTWDFANDGYYYETEVDIVEDYYFDDLFLGEFDILTLCDSGLGNVSWINEMPGNGTVEDFCSDPDAAYLGAELWEFFHHIAEDDEYDEFDLPDDFFTSDEDGCDEYPELCDPEFEEPSINASTLDALKNDLESFFNSSDYFDPLSLFDMGDSAGKGADAQRAATLAATERIDAGRYDWLINIANGSTVSDSVLIPIFGSARFVPPSSFIVEAKASEVVESLLRPEISTAVLLPPTVKFSTPSCKSTSNTTDCSTLQVVLSHKVATQAQLLRIAKSWQANLTATPGSPVGATVKVAGPRLITVSRTSGSKYHYGEILKFLATQPLVESVQPKSRRKAHGLKQNQITVSGSLSPSESGLYKLWENGELSGSGQIVHVGDTGVKVDSCFFSDNSSVPFNKIDPQARKIVTYKYNPIMGDKDVDGAEDHGTHCAGIAVAHKADSAATLEGNGIAWGAKLAFHDITMLEDGVSTLANIPDDLGSKYFAWASRAGSRISSNSWGSQYDPDGNTHDLYDIQSREIDQYAIDSPEFLVLVAAGNDGDLGPGSVGAPAGCKNCLSVGASWNDDVDALTSFSSRGPAVGARIKPDIVAPGGGAISVEASSLSCATLVQSGTSQACPNVAGAAAIVRQYLADGFYPTWRKTPSSGIAKPTNALVRAMLINSATPLKTIKNNEAPLADGDYGEASLQLGRVPSPYQGHGRVNLERILRVESGPQFGLMIKDKQSISRLDERVEYEFSVTEGQAVFATLVWNDPLPAQGAKLLLVNDIDITVRLEGKQHYPNGRQTADRFNNVEKVITTAATVSGKAVVTVTAHRLASIPAGGQSYALVVAEGIPNPTPACDADICADIDAWTKDMWDYSYSKPPPEFCEGHTQGKCTSRSGCGWCSFDTSAGRCMVTKGESRPPACYPSEAFTTASGTLLPVSTPELLPSPTGHPTNPPTEPTSTTEPPTSADGVDRSLLTYASTAGSIRNFDNPISLLGVFFLVVVIQHALHGHQM